MGRRTRETLVHRLQCPAFSDFGIRMAGISAASSEFHFLRRNPDMIQILLCEAGEGMVWLESGWRACRPGQAYLTPAWTPHSYRAGRAWEVAWVILDPGALPDFPEEPELVRVEGLPLKALVRGLQEEVAFHRHDLLELWITLLHRHLVSLRHAAPRRLGALWVAVEADLGGAWTLPRMARSAGLGEENLRLVCRRETGHSPMQHVTLLRMRHAVSLLALGHKVEYVATRVGYENPFAFSVAFKRVIGHPPSVSSPAKQRRAG